MSSGRATGLNVGAGSPLTTTRIAGALLLGFLGGCARASQAPDPPRSDHAVYALVVREFFLRPPEGEHALLCEDRPLALLVIGSQTRPLWHHTPRRDSAAAAELPARAAPLVKALRAMDTLPRRSLAADSFVVGIPVRLHADSGAERETTTREESVPHLATHAPPVIRFSRVAYDSDSTLALVYAVKKCQEKFAGEAEEGAYGVAVLVPLERREGTWVALDSLYLNVD